jgi:hypothetical protein
VVEFAHPGFVARRVAEEYFNHKPILIQLIKTIFNALPCGL